MRICRLCPANTYGTRACESVESMGIRDMLFGKRRVEIYSTPDDKRPVKLVPDGEDSWRVVYADEEQ